jgi:hypothetical protein
MGGHLWAIAGCSTGERVGTLRRADCPDDLRISVENDAQLRRIRCGFW